MTGVGRPTGHAPRVLSSALPLLLLVVVGCGSTVPPSPTSGPAQVTPVPTATSTNAPATPTPSSTPPVKDLGPLALEECDQLGYVPCEHQAVVLGIPVAGTGVALTYSSERTPGRLDRPEIWTPTEVRLGGWSLDVLQHYDATNKVLLNGNGTWRLAESTPIGDGASVVPSYDGRFAFVFDADNRHTRTVDAILGVDLITFDYDGDGRLVSARGSLGSAVIDLTVDRNPDGLVAGLIGAGGSRTDVIYDGIGRLGAVTHPDGGREGLVSEANGLLATYIDPSGAVTRFEYDAAGRLSTVIDPDGVTVRYERTGSQHEVAVRVTPPIGGEHIYGARQLDSGLERSYVAPDGPTTSLVASADGSRVVALPDGTRITVGARPDERWRMASPILTPVVVERPDGVVRRTEIERVVQQSADDPLRLTNWTQTTTINGDSYTESYDPASRAVTVADPMGRRQTATYDDRGRAIAYSSPGQPSAGFAYDAESRLERATWGTGAGTASTTYSYGPDGLVTMTHHDGTTETLVVDALGRFVRQTAGDGSSLLSSYDATGRLISIRPGAGQSTTLGHSQAGRPTAVVAPALPDDTSWERRAYDDAGRLAGISGPGEREIALSYDDFGRLGEVTFDRGTISAQYDPATGRPVAISAPSGVMTTYGYVGGLLAGIAWSGPQPGDVFLELDSLGRVVSETVNAAAPVRSAYDSAGVLSSVGPISFGIDEATGLQSTADLGAVRLAWQFDANGRVSSATTTANDSVLLVLRYERDSFGRIARVIEESPAGARSTDYRYDGAGRLAAVTVDGVVVHENEYDASGNRTAVTGSGSSVAAEYDARNRLRRWAGTSFDYRPDGTVARRTDGDDVSTYDYDDLGALRGVVLPDGDRVEYILDWSGRRIGRQVNGVLEAGYLYRPDGPLVAEVDGTGSMVARFVYDGRGALVSLERDGRTYLIVTDHLGSPKLIVDSVTGEIAQELEYDAWGRVVGDSNPGFQPFGFAGGLLDLDTGLTHFGAREYDPTVGRWVSADPIGFRSSDANLYAYAGNDPVNRSDPSGLDAAGCVTGIGCTSSKDTICVEGEGCVKSSPPGERSFPADKPWDVGVHETCVTGIGCLPNSGSKSPPPGPAPVAKPGELCVTGIGCFPPDAGAGPPAPAPPNPGQNGGGFTCIGVCVTPGGGICVGYCSSGDPHLRTADGLGVSFQGAGEYVMITSTDESVVLQARQEPPGDVTEVTSTTAVAASVAGDRVGVYLNEELTLVVNGESVTGIETSRGLANGGSVQRHGTLVNVEWPDGSRLTVDQRGSHLDYGFVPDAEIAPTLTGLMGTPDADAANDLVSRDGGLVLDPQATDFFEQLHGPFGDSWRVSAEESLFDYAPGESTATFTRPDLPNGPATADTLDPTARAAAEELCRAAGVTSEPTLSDCIVDVGMTSDTSYAASAAAVEAATQVADGGLRGAPVPITYGSAQAGRLANPDEVARYAFEASAGDAIMLDAIGSCIAGLQWLLLGPDDAHLLSGLTCSDLGPWTLRTAGTYLIEVYSDAGATGPYAFELRAEP